MPDSRGRNVRSSALTSRFKLRLSLLTIVTTTRTSSWKALRDIQSKFVAALSTFEKEKSLLHEGFIIDVFVTNRCVWNICYVTIENWVMIDVILIYARGSKIDLIILEILRRSTSEFSKVIISCKY